MFRLIRSTPEAGDCTCGYKVLLDKEYTVQEFVDTILFEKKKENTEFEIIKVIDEYEYKYGFEYNEENIVSEWMYRKNLNTSRNSTIFERYMNKVEFGASVRKECDIYKEQIPSETVFRLSASYYFSAVSDILYPA